MRLRQKGPQKGHQKGGAWTQPVNRNGHVIGLDLGATSIRAAILALSTKGERLSVTLHDVGSVALPAGAIVNGAVTELSDIAKAVANNHFAASVAGFIRNLTRGLP